MRDVDHDTTNIETPLGFQPLKMQLEKWIAEAKKHTTHRVIGELYVYVLDIFGSVRPSSSVGLNSNTRLMSPAIPTRA
ncbi:hypothetical protein LR68_02897 [Anoxybacillus sp. BCO1]|nr:hypothetical protein LR68_02897 [Anoxybacillus sp. BCO1]